MYPPALKVAHLQVTLLPPPGGDHLQDLHHGRDHAQRQDGQGVAPVGNGAFRNVQNAPMTDDLEDHLMLVSS